MVALLAGILVAAGQNFDSLAPWGNTIAAATGVGPAAIVGFGLGLIGLRGKDD